MTNKIMFIGDTHGDFYFLKSCIWRANIDPRTSVKSIIQVGDFGFYWDDSYLTTIKTINSYLKADGTTLYFIDGNHENFDLLESLGAYKNGKEPVYLESNIVYLPRGIQINIEGYNIVSFGGAYSVDEEYRTYGESIWEQENITRNDVEQFLETYDSSIPTDILVCHETPFDKIIISKKNYWPNHKSSESRSNLLDVYNIVKPKKIVHGHHHYYYTTKHESSWGDVDIVGLDCNGNPGSIEYI